MSKQNLWDWLESNENLLIDIAQKIWDNPEPSLEEKFASDLQSSILEKEGFRINKGTGEMPTAFVAEYGDGSPILGVLGEYDALPGLSQKKTAHQEVAKEGAAGHGCGHSLLGTAGLGAALAIKQAIDEGEITGTVRYYGCPAEETLVGKVFMARNGVFDDLDACLSWHPMQANKVWGSSSLAMNSVRFKFRGRAAHAAASPDMGRSALDAVELMDIGANYLREHISDEARIHYSITDGGGEPNIVPAKASVWYYIRAPKREEVEEIYERLIKIADGAAMMNETDVEREFLAGCYDVLPNDILADVIYQNMKTIGAPEFSAEEMKFAEDLANTFSKGQKEKVMKGAPEEIIKKTLHDGIAEAYDKGTVMPGSTDVGDVSWITPLAQFTTATWPVGTAAHSWQATASTGSNIGYKGMLFASKILAATLYDLFMDNALIEDARIEFNEKTANKKYVSPLPKGIEPPFDQFKH